MRHLIRLLAALALLLLLAAPAFAQGSLTITDPGRRLDRAAVERAARPLLDRGAEVAVYLVQSGSDQDFVERLIDDGLARSDGAARSNMIAIYVALDQRSSFIRYGDGWYDALGVNDNYENIRSGDLGPGLADGDYTGAFVAALGAIEQAIVSPPSPDGTVNVDTVPIAAGGLALAAAAAGGAVVISRRRAARTRAEALQRLQTAREDAATLITDLGRRFNDAAEKARYDKVSYAPADVAQLARGQQAAAQAFAQVQTSFDDIGEQLERFAKPTLEQYAQATAGYAQARAQADQVSAQLAQVEQRRQELDALARQAPEEIARAKKS